MQGAVAGAGARVAGWLASPLPWIVAGLVFLALGWAYEAGPRSPFWWAELPLHLALLAAVLRPGLLRLPLSRLPRARAAAPWVFVALSWGFGMVYEATLTVDGSGIGGVHPDTRASFLLAQADYVMIALVTLALVRWLRLDLGQVFHLAGGKSMTEGLVFTGVLAAAVLAGQWGVAPLVLAYYALVYAGFMALPLAFVDARLLWAKPERGPSRLALPWLWVVGFVAAFAIRLVWGLGWAPFATWLWGLPPNPV